MNYNFNVQVKESKREEEVLDILILETKSNKAISLKVNESFEEWETIKNVNFEIQKGISLILKEIKEEE